MSDVAIKFENVSKLYELGTVGTGTLSHDLKRWWITSVLHKEDPYLKIGETNDRSTKGDSKFVYALKDIDFEVKQGDVLGIIGKNGAGKSTLLKLLSRVTYPTTGNIYVNGRIASLLEVGTGFHPELTGRENIYMNGTILGMKKWEIDKQLDEIVDFSGCERYLDTPVKRYSSGMTVRLGFAIAAHLNPEILVVDEVLAVGDAEFQKKAIGKMQDVSQGQGRTVLFVSHNMNSIRALCQTGIILNQGNLIFSETANECVDRYIGEENQILRSHSNEDELVRKFDTIKTVEITNVKLNNNPTQIATDEPLSIEITLRKNKPTSRLSVEVIIDQEDGQTVGSYVSPIYDISQYDNLFKVSITDFHHNLAKGYYKLNFNVGLKDLAVGIKDYDIVYGAISFRVDYLDQATYQPIQLWPKSWGSINYSHATVSFSNNQ